MSIIRVTRRHLHSVCLELVDALEKDRSAVIPALMKRYYKLNALHVSQLTRYLKMCNPIECKVLEHNKMYLLQLTRMFSQRGGGGGGILRMSKAVTTAGAGSGGAAFITAA